MDTKEIQELVDELELRIDRIRSLYEQYFMGIEKIEPMVARKDIDRRIQVLRHEQIRNTGIRFRFQMLVQKYNTYGSYWMRICRQIEEGTYKRDLRARHRRSVLPAARVSVAAPPVSSPEPAAKKDDSLFGGGLDLELEAAFSSVRKQSVAPAAARADGSVVIPKAPGVPEFGPPTRQPARVPELVRRISSSQMNAVKLNRNSSRPPAPEAKKEQSREDRMKELAARIRTQRDGELKSKLGTPPQPPPPPPKAPPPSERGPTLTFDAPRPAPGTPPPPRVAPPPPRSVPPRPPPPPAARAAQADPDDARMRELYSKYVETKRKQNESTAAVTFEGVSKSIRESREKLKEKHKGKNVDFEVMVKDGKTVLKPIVK